MVRFAVIIFACGINKSGDFNVFFSALKEEMKQLMSVYYTHVMRGELIECSVTVISAEGKNECRVEKGNNLVQYGGRSLNIKVNIKWERDSCNWDTEVPWYFFIFCLYLSLSRSHFLSVCLSLAF